MKEKRFVEDFNEIEEPDEDLEEEFEKLDKKFPDDSSEDESLLEEELEEPEETPDFFDDNFSVQRRTRTTQINPSLEAEPIQNLERDLQNIPVSPAGNPQEKNPENLTGEIIYNAPQYGSSYESNMYATNVRENTQVDITGGASAAGREINFKRWQETSLGYPEQRAGTGQGEQYIRTPEKTREETRLPFQNRNQPRTMEWKEEY
jgi:hypothetical protein